jgi:hypothetical protein
MGADNAGTKGGNSAAGMAGGSAAKGGRGGAGHGGSGGSAEHAGGTGPGAAGAGQGGDDETGTGGVSGARPSGGEGGEITSGRAGKGGTSSTGAQAGEGGANDGCVELACQAHASCRSDGETPMCVCDSGYEGDGTICTPFASCAALHAAEPNLPSGMHPIKPAGSSEFSAYCEMETDGGGWTLALNQGTSFDKTVAGTAGAACYDANCVSLAYSTVPVVADVMLDAADTDITGETFMARSVITGIAASSRAKTLAYLFQNGPFYLDAEDNHNMTTTGCTSAIPSDYASAVCDSRVLTFGDVDNGCGAPGTSRYALGLWTSYTVDYANCAGWPQTVDYGDTHYWPRNFRIWVR